MFYTEIFKGMLPISPVVKLTGLIDKEVKSCYNPLRLETVIVLVSSGIDFVNTPRLYSDKATLMVCARGSPKCLDFTRNTLQLN